NEYTGGGWQNDSMGWTTINVGACPEVRSGPLTDNVDPRIRPPRQYYLLVREQGRLWENAKDYGKNSQIIKFPFCFNASADFLLLENQSTPASCQRHDFFRIDTGNKPNSLVNIVPRG